MRRALLAACALVLVGTAVARAGGNREIRDPSDPAHVIETLWDRQLRPVVHWVLSSDGIPGSSIDNATLAAELGAAFDTWKAVPTASIDHFYDGVVDARQHGGQSALGAGIDGRNLVTFTDPDFDFPPGVLAVSIDTTILSDVTITAANADLDGDGTADLALGTYPAGTVFDADIVFNSSVAWNVTGDFGTNDVRAVALHEIGHLFGLCHSVIRDAVMWPFEDQAVSTARVLKPDDIAWISAFYPPDSPTGLGSIQGKVTNGATGLPVLGAHVYTVDPTTHASLVGAYSADDGSYVIPSLPPGSYLVAIEPLDGDPPGLDPSRINEVVQSTHDTSFPEEFYDAAEGAIESDPMAALPVTVTADVVRTGIDLVTNTLTVPSQSVALAAGFNLFAWPVAVPDGTTAFDLLAALGGPDQVDAVDRFVPATGLFERAQHVAGVPAGVDFPIRRGEGYAVYAHQANVASFAGGTDCPVLGLAAGLNLIGVPCPPFGYTAFELLADLGSPSEVESVTRWDPDAAAFQIAHYDGAGNPAGDDFPIANGEGYAVVMRLAKPGVRLPAPGRATPPHLDGVSPGEGVPGTLVALLGAGFDPDPAKDLISFNGVPAAAIVATATTLTAFVPGAATSGPLMVTVGGRQSNALPFVVEPAEVQAPDGGIDLVSGQTALGTLSADGEQDRFTFTALAGSVVTITATAVTPGIPDLVLVLEDPFGVAVATDDNGGGGTDARINAFVLQTTGEHTIVVSNVPGSGTGAYRLGLTIATRSAPPALSILGGNFQSGLMGGPLDDPLSVLATGPTGAPVAGVPVTFTATGAVISGGTVSRAAAGTVVLATNSSGVVSVSTVLPGTPGTYDITVQAPGLPPAKFTVAATATAVQTVTMTGDGQTGTVATQLPDPLAVVLTDAAGMPVQGALVSFQVVSGGGTVNPAAAQVSRPNGSASVIFDLGTSVDVPQIVAAFVPGRKQPLLFEATAVAAGPAKIQSNRSNFNRMTIGTTRKNALWVRVLDPFGNPVPGATIRYDAPPGLAVLPGLGPGGEQFTNFMTDADGLHVAMVNAPVVAGLPIGTLIPAAPPTIDEYGVHRLSPYAIMATVDGTPLTQTYFVDLDMGPGLVTGTEGLTSALIGQPLPDQVRKQVLRFERYDANLNGDFRDDDFTRVNNFPVSGVTVKFSVRREDSFKETDYGLQPTTTAIASDFTGPSGGVATDVTIGDVGGVQDVLGTASQIKVTYKNIPASAPTSAKMHVFTDPNQFADSTKVTAIPVTVVLDATDSGSGLDFTTLRGMVNGTTFFDGTAPPAVPPIFPEHMTVRVGGRLLTSLSGNLARDSAFGRVTITYQPARPKLVAGANTAQLGAVADRAGNVQAAPTVQPFTYP